MKNNKNVSRKAFLQKLGLGVVAVPLATLGISSFKKEEEIIEQNDCGLTDWATEGPFYVRNTKESVNINFTNLPGNAMKVTGTVYSGTDQSNPIADAKIEIWHADKDGIYHPTGDGDITRYKPSEIELRGFVITDKNGQYAFHSIEPGLYSGRRRHIHYKISAKNHESITTQSYWLSEKGTKRERIDRTDSNTEDCRYIDFKNSKNGIAGTFDIYLKPTL
ncbi:hypothetical protein [Kordia sp.]|uniref:dioxygenase family protein n=1 Tax=Kordia sp. TaxID=1965332 RepID=UPI003D6A2E18